MDDYRLLPFICGNILRSFRLQITLRNISPALVHPVFRGGEIEICECQPGDHHLNKNLFTLSLGGEPQSDSPKSLTSVHGHLGFVPAERSSCLKR